MSVLEARLRPARPQAIELGPTGDSSSDSGVFYPLKGWGTVRDALLHAVEESGVTCLWNTAAEEVVVQGGAVCAVRVAPSATPPTAVTRAAATADPCREFEAARGERDAADGGEASYTLPAECVVVNADVATAETTLLPAALRRSEYVEQSELSLSTKMATAGRALRKVIGHLSPRRASSRHGLPKSLRSDHGLSPALSSGRVGARRRAEDRHGGGLTGRC